MNQNLKIGQGFRAPGFFGEGIPGEPPRPHPAGMWGSCAPLAMGGHPDLAGPPPWPSPVGLSF